MMTTLRSAAKQLPIIRDLIAQRDQLQTDLLAAQADRSAARADRSALIRALDRLGDAGAGATDTSPPSVASELARLREACGFVPPGHFYSPIPALAEIRRDAARIFPAQMPHQIAGIDLRESAQLALLEQFARYYPEIPFQERPTKGLRYHFDNRAYSYSDGIMLHCMLRHLRPRRLVEIGSGFSSCVTLDTNELFLDGELQTTFIEPYPDLLNSLLSAADRQRVTILAQRLQDVDLSVFTQLQAGDVLFVDSTHVSRVDSDVNRLFFEILPALAAGVAIHVHDMFYPFEYPQHWIYEGRAWNELYLMRGFLQYNSNFEILLLNTFMEHFHRPFIEQHMPLCLKNTGGSLWLRKTAA